MRGRVAVASGEGVLSQDNWRGCASVEQGGVCCLSKLSSEGDISGFSRSQVSWGFTVHGMRASSDNFDQVHQAAAVARTLTCVRKLVCLDVYGALGAVGTRVSRMRW